MPCNITGTLRSPDGAALANTRVIFKPFSDAAKKEGDARIGTPVEVISDASGDLEFALYADRYRALVRAPDASYRFEMLVPEGLEDAELSDLIDLADMDDDSAFTVRWGVSAADTLDSDGVLALPFSSFQAGSVSVDATMAADGEFIYVAFPASFTPPTIYELFGWETDPVETSVTVTEGSNAHDYTVWRSINALTDSAVTIRVATTGA